MQYPHTSNGWVAGAAAAIATLLGGAAQAAVVTETVPANGTDFADIGRDIYVPIFNSALGTLTAASVSLIGQFTPAVAFGFNSPPSPPLTPVRFVNPFVYTASLGSQSASYVVGPGLDARAVGTPEAVSVVDKPLVLSNLPIAPFDPNLLDFYIVASSGAVLPPDSFFTADQGDLTAQLTVTYTYTPGAAVPEPASLIVLGAALLGLGAVRFRERPSAPDHESSRAGLGPA